LDDRSDEETEFMCDDEAETMSFEEVRTIFILKDGSVHSLQDILSVAGNRAITVKEIFYSKPINILVDIECDIVLYHTTKRVEESLQLSSLWI
jgi:hypothetical protein